VKIPETAKRNTVRIFGVQSLKIWSKHLLSYLPTSEFLIHHHVTRAMRGF
jgi:hypothetical protein